MTQHDAKAVLEQLVARERLVAPGEAVRTANWQALQTQLTNPAAPSSATATATTAKKLGGLVLAVGLLYAVGALVLGSPDRPAPTNTVAGSKKLVSTNIAQVSVVAPSTAQGVSATARLNTPSEQPPQLPKAVATPVIATTANTQDALANRQQSTRPPKQSDTDGWDAQLKLLKQAEASLRTKQFVQALARTERYRKRWPRGEFVEAIHAARVLALCGLERTDQANKARQHFDATWPHSLYAERIRDGCTASPAQ